MYYTDDEIKGAVGYMLCVKEDCLESMKNEDVTYKITGETTRCKDHKKTVHI
jgi:hypothetical protein